LRDGQGRLLADFRRMPGAPERFAWGTVVAVNRRPDWQPFGQSNAAGPHRNDGSFFVRTAAWRPLTPAQLMPRACDYFSRAAGTLRVIGDVGVESFTPEQMDGLRGMVERGRTLLLCGGTDRARLAGWERAGLLAVPVTGVRTLPGLFSAA